MNGRSLRFQVAAGVGYSFLVSALTLGLELVAYIFYPVKLVLSPLWAIYAGQWVDLGLILALYAVLIAFASPYGLRGESAYYGTLKGIRGLAIRTIIALAVLSMAFDAYGGPLRTRAGIFIAVNIAAGVVGGAFRSSS